MTAKKPPGNSRKRKSKPAPAKPSSTRRSSPKAKAPTKKRVRKNPESPAAVSKETENQQVVKPLATKENISNIQQLSSKPFIQKAAIVQDELLDKFELLNTVLIQSGFWLDLETVRAHCKKDPGKMRIVIKPEMSMFDQSGAAVTDPELVEHLIDLLHARDYSQVVVAESRNSFDIWLENRDVLALADLSGYQFITPSGGDYDVVDLSDDLIGADFPEGNILSGSHLSSTWLQADYRICFTKNKTDEANAYGLCLQSLIDILPLRDKDFHYRFRLKPCDVALALYQHCPPEFSLIDAVVSSHGSAGGRVPKPLKTSTIIASKNLLLADVAAAKKMGVDPNASAINAKALSTLGLPEPNQIEGDLTQYKNWVNVHPVMLDSVRKRQQWPEVHRILQPWLQSIDNEYFPFKDPVNERINQVLTKYLSNVDESQSVFWTMVSLNYLLSFIHQWLMSVQTMSGKDRLWRKEVPLNISPSGYPPVEFESIEAYLAPIEKRVMKIQADANGLRWERHEDGSILFEFSREIPVPFEEFCARVDVSKGIQYMNDYIGGVIIPITRDKQGRVTHQIERNLYLPQPNYLVLYQGQDIDVTKLEHVTYTPNQQRMVWKTILSENGSAQYDDGAVTFTKSETGDTLVSIFGRQLFALPMFWQVVDLDQFPQLKKVLVTHAYTTFFTNTLANFEAVYEGREVRIGRDLNALSGEPDDTSEIKTPSELLINSLTKAQDFIVRNVPDKSNIIANIMNAYKPKPESIDGDGFAHFNAGTGDHDADEASQEELDFKEVADKTKHLFQDIWHDLAVAVEKDWGVHES